MADLTTNYLGLELKNPLIASASPLSKRISSVKHMQDAGISAVVLYSLFEEEIRHESLELDYYLNKGTEQYPEALTYFPELDYSDMGTEKYLNHIKTLKECVEIPVIASLNGVSNGGWIKLAKQVEQAGADALELNIFHLPLDKSAESGSIEKNYIKLIAEIRKIINIPVALKLSPYFTSIPHISARAIAAGANGLVLFNRFMQPDIDVETLEVLPRPNLSTSNDLLLPLRWIALLYGKLQTDFALSSGIHTHIDMIKAIMAGASVTMVASEFLRNGIDQAQLLLRDLNSWMDSNGYKSVKKMRGCMSQEKTVNPASFERAQYMKALRSFEEHIL